MRIGIGYDVHRLAEEYRLILGGVEIPHSRGLVGHSDADVLVHAIMDALLGAAALGDIGQLFPDSDPAYRGISSLKLLMQVASRLQAGGYTIVNIDSTILAEEPKLMNYLPQMAENIAETLQISPNLIGIKATTSEGLGFIGRQEGIAAQAVVLIEKG